MTTSTVARPALAAPRIASEPSRDGGVILRSLDPLEPYEASVGLLLRRWAAQAPQRTFIAERAPDGDWREVAYAEAHERARAVAQWMLDRGLGVARPVMVLSGNSVDHALLMLGAFLAGVPIVPVSPAYSLLSADLGKLRHIAGLVRPGAVYVDDATRFAAALRVPELAGVEVLTAVPESAPTAAVDEALERVGPDSVAKVLFTSGSTDMPKGVLTTHGMLTSNQQALAQVWPFTAETPPVLVDWLPWNHTFGGNHNFNLVLKRGGTLHVDAGKPAPGMLAATLRNLAEVSPTIYFNVPAGYAQLLPHLERDAALRARFFARLQLIFYAGAALSQDLWDRLEAVAIEERGEPVMMTSSWGLTETAPLATAAHFPIPRAGIIGVPVPGVEIKLVPHEDKQELRVRGPNVTPGYLGRDDLTASAFDADGFYRTGDAGRLEDPQDPNRGLVFDGRTVEDFKLSSGTYVSVGRLRVAVLAAAGGVLQDAVVCGHDRDAIGLLAWLNPDAARRACGDEAAGTDELCRSPRLLAGLRRALAEHNARHPGSSTRVARMLLLREPPSLDANEITDKGYVNQRAALRRRAADVERLYADPPGDGVVVVDRV